MNPTVYVQMNADGDPYSVSGAAGERGFASLGYPTQRFLRAQIADLPLSPENIVVGGLGCLHAVWEQIGVRIPQYVSAPAVLVPFLGRESSGTTAEELTQTARFPVFVKPYEDSKVFNGAVIRSAEELHELLPADTALLAQEPVTFLSEWRVFVLRGRAVAIAHYRATC